MKTNCKITKKGCLKKIALLLFCLLINYSSILEAQTRAFASTIATTTLISIYQIQKKSDINIDNITTKVRSGVLALATGSIYRKASSYNNKTKNGTVNVKEAAFNVTDAGNATYSISLSSTNLLVYNGTENMKVDTLTCSSSKVLSNGTDVIYLGAKIYVDANQAHGTYSNLASGLEVSVNYN